MDRFKKMRILIISPFAAERIALEELLRGDGHDVVAAADRAGGLAIAAAAALDLVIADAQVPELDGVALVRALAERGAPPRVILLCRRANRVVEKHGVVCLTKPIELGDLLAHVALRRTPEARVA